MPTILPVLVALTFAQLPDTGPGKTVRPERTAAEDPAVGEEPGAEDGAREPTRRYVIERIELRGLSRTRPDAVRRHLLFEEGEVFDPERVLLSRLGLLQLGWFSRVQTHIERGSQRGKVLVVFDMVERNTLIVTDLVIGSTPPQPIYGGLGLSEQNFMGQGLGLSGGFVFGGAPAGRVQDPNRWGVRASFFAPDLWVPNLRLVAGVSGLFLRGEELACGDDAKCGGFTHDFGQAPRLRYQRAGGELLLGIRPGPFERLSATYRLERVRGTHLDLAPDEGPFLKDGWTTMAAASAIYEVDTRDDFFFPTEGFHAMGQVMLASKLVGGDYEFSRYLIQTDTAYSLFRLPLRLQTAVGAVQGDAPFFERFYAADYSYFALGPALGRAMELNFSTDSRYDRFLAMAGMEYAFPLWSRADSPFHRAYLAVGARAVYSSAELGGGRTEYSRIPLSADVALRLDTLIGTFNLSVGYLLDNVL